LLALLRLLLFLLQMQSCQAALLLPLVLLREWLFLLPKPSAFDV
jgi:hypothetical protein